MQPTAPAPTTPNAPAPATRFTEPTEGAFTLALPPGWTVQAGVARGPLGPRPWYRALSPGGTAEVRGSDPRVPQSFTVPAGPMMMPLPGMILRPYAPPHAFAEEYAHNFARDLGASSLTVTGVRDLEAMLHDDPRPESRSNARTLVQSGADYGGISFTAQTPQRPLRGVVDVVTLRMPGPVGMTWSPIVTALVGPVEGWPHARATLLHIAHSYTTNDAWQRTQSQLSAMQHQATMESIETGNRILRMQAQSGMEAIGAHAQRAHIAAQTSAEVTAMQSQAWQQQQASGDEQQRRNVNAIRETVDVYDPSSGQVFHGAPAGFTTWWTDGADRVVGSTGYENPDPARYTQAVDLDEVNKKR